MRRVTMKGQMKLYLPFHFDTSQSEEEFLNQYECIICRVRSLNYLIMFLDHDTFNGFF